MSRRWSLLVAGALVLAPAAPALAHSLLLESAPVAGARLPVSPQQVALRFNNRIEKGLSRVRLVDDRGDGRSLVVERAGGGNDVLRASLPSLGPGAYRIEWRVLSTDGHVVSGSFSFRVAP